MTIFRGGEDVAVGGENVRRLSIYGSDQAHLDIHFCSHLP